MDIINSTLSDLKTALDNKTITSEAIVRFYLDRIDNLDNDIKAYLHVAKESALKQAKEYDAKRAKGEKLPKYAGLPIALKDLVVTKDMPTTCSSLMLKDFYSPYDATIVNLLRDAGFIVLGKLNMDQFAMGSSGETSYYQKTVNPWNFKKVPGGSSSGSVASVAASLTPVAIGSDTGGSIRQPAAYCGVCGFKPTYGLVSRNGAVGYASSLDQLGPVGKNVKDIALIMDIIAKKDPLDPTSVSPTSVGVKDDGFLVALNGNIKGIKIGLPDNYLSAGVAPAVKKAILEAIEIFKSLGAEVVNLSMPLAKYGLPVYQMIANAEASSNLAKFDGIEFGYRADTTDLYSVYSLSRGEGFGPEVKKRLILGTYILQKDQYDDFYIKAMKVRQLIRNEFDDAFKKCDFIIGPTAATTAFEFGGKSRSAMEMYLNDLYTVLLNLNGSCGISIPCGFDEDNMPIGLQLQGDMFKDQELLNAAYAYQNATEWHKKSPKLG